MRTQPEYGIDSPTIVIGELILGGAACSVALLLLVLRALLLVGVIGMAIGLFVLLNAGSMVFYSKVGKRSIRDQLLRLVAWRGDEVALDVGCGRGLLLVGVARRLTTGKAIGVDRWIRGAISGNRLEATLENAALERVADLVEVQDGDARHLPFDDHMFDVVVSNFVVHEMDTRTDREKMLREIIRVLKPGGQIALVDFIFTGEAVQVLRRSGVQDARRLPIRWPYFWFSALSSLGMVQVYQVIGHKDPDSASRT